MGERLLHSIGIVSILAVSGVAPAAVSTDTFDTAHDYITDGVDGAAGGTGTTNYMFLTPAQGTTGPMTFADGTGVLRNGRKKRIFLSPRGKSCHSFVETAPTRSIAAFQQPGTGSNSQVQITSPGCLFSFPPEIRVTQPRSACSGDVWLSGAANAKANTTSTSPAKPSGQNGGGGKAKNSGKGRR